VLLFTGLRIAELVALDVDDLSISPRKGQLTVRRGKVTGTVQARRHRAACAGRRARYRERCGTRR